MYYRISEKSTVSIVSKPRFHIKVQVNNVLINKNADLLKSLFHWNVSYKKEKATCKLIDMEIFLLFIGNQFQT